MKKHISSKQNKKIRTGILVVLLFLVLAAGGVYFYVAHLYQGYFLPGTIINQVDVGGHTLEEYEAYLEKQVSKRSLSVTFPGGETEVISAPQIDLNYLPDDALKDFVNRQFYPGWIAGLLGWQRVYTYEPTISYDYIKLMELMKYWPALDPDNVTEPQNAYVEINDENRLEIVPEVMGDTIDTEVLKAELRGAIENNQPSLDLSKNENLYLRPSVYSDDEALNKCLEDINPILETTVTYKMSNGTKEVLDGSVMRNWLVKDENGLYTLDDKALSRGASSYIQYLASKDDNFGFYRAFTSTNFGPLRLASDSLHGHQLDRIKMADELISDLKAHTSAEHDMTYSVFDDENDDRLGGTYVEIDIDCQTVYFYRNSELEYSTPCVTGLNNKTPLGIFEIEQKWKDTILEGAPKEDGTPSYQVHVDFFLQFYPSYGLHDASWRASYEFGGATYLYDGSHGCVNIPYDAAEYFYYNIDEGTPVIVFSESGVEYEQQTIDERMAEYVASGAANASADAAAAEDASDNADSAENASDSTDAEASVDEDASAEADGDTEAEAEGDAYTDEEAEES